MAYTPGTWVENVTVIHAADLARIEAGIAANAAEPIGTAAQAAATSNTTAIAARAPLPVAATPGYVATVAADGNTITYTALPASVYDVKRYGAKGDGTTDDTTAIRAAYTACPTGGVLYFPPGTYIMAAGSTYSYALSVAKAITLQGSAGAVLKAAATAPVGTRLLQITADDVTVYSLGFDGNAVGSVTCCYISSCARTVITNCRFLNPGAGGVCANDNVTDLLVMNNQFLGGPYGVLVNDQAGHARMTFSGNVFNGNGVGGDAIEINGSVNPRYDINCTGNTISNYPSVNPSTGFGIAYAYVIRGTITGNVVNGCGRNCIHIEAKSSNITISGNTCYGANHAGIEVQGESGSICNNITIANNVVSNCCIAPSVNLGRGGIDIGSSTGAPFTGGGAVGISVMGNIVEGCRGAGIYLFGSTTTFVMGNSVKNTYGVSTDTAHAVQNAGIHAISCTNSQFSHNNVVDTQGGSATQYYPTYFYGGATGILTALNFFTGNLAGPADITTGVAALFNNVGPGGTGYIRIDSANKLGFFGAVPSSRAALAAVATDAATTQSLANDIRAKLVALGLSL